MSIFNVKVLFRLSSALLGVLGGFVPIKAGASMDSARAKVEATTSVPWRPIESPLQRRPEVRKLGKKLKMPELNLGSLKVGPNFAGSPGIGVLFKILF